MEDTIHSSAEAAQEAVCRRAVELNVRGFLVWLQGMEVGSSGGGTPGEEGPIDVAEDDLMGPDEEGGISASEQTEGLDEAIPAAATEEACGDEAGQQSRGQAESVYELASGDRDDGNKQTDGEVEGKSSVAHDVSTPEALTVSHKENSAPPMDANETSAARRSSTPIKREPGDQEIWTPRVVPEEIDWQSQLARKCNLIRCFELTG